MSYEAAPGGGHAAAPAIPLASDAAALEPGVQKPGAAFVDLDNTLVQGASLYYLARLLFAERWLGPTDVAKVIWNQAAFRFRGVEDAGHIDATRHQALAFVQGRRQDELVALAQRIYDEKIRDKIWAGARELIDQHLRAGEMVFALSATPDELAKIVGKGLGLTGAFGTVAETDENGVYTGRLVGGLLHGQAKADAIVRLAEQYGLDLSRCSAYSDSINDLPMLELVGHPHVVNPDAELRRVAETRGWPIHEFRLSRTVAATARKNLRRAGRAAAPVAAGVGAAAANAAGALGRRHKAHSTGHKPRSRTGLTLD